MRAFSLSGFCCLCLFLAGCESLSNRVSVRFTPVPPQVRDYAKPSRDVFEAALHALKTIDFVVTRSGQAQGIIEAHSRLLPGEDFGSHRQYIFKIRLTVLEPELTRVSALLQRDTDDRSAAAESSENLGAHGLYDSLFAALQQELGGAEPVADSGDNTRDSKE